MSVTHYEDTWKADPDRKVEEARAALLERVRTIAQAAWGRKAKGGDWVQVEMALAEAEKLARAEGQRQALPFAEYVGLVVQYMEKGEPYCYDTGLKEQGQKLLAEYRTRILRKAMSIEDGFEELGDAINLYWQPKPGSSEAVARDKVREYAAALCRDVLGRAGSAGCTEEQAKLWNDISETIDALERGSER